jgi:plastocyanin
MIYRRTWRVLAVVGAVLVSSVLPATMALAAAPASAFKVSIVNSGGSCSSLYCFQPGSATISSGQAVKWTNNSSASHTVSRCTIAACGVGRGTGTDRGPNSPTLTPGATFFKTFTGKGTYVYYCKIHGYSVMHGTITVK